MVALPFRTLFIGVTFVGSPVISSLASTMVFHKEIPFWNPSLSLLQWCFYFKRQSSPPCNGSPKSSTFSLFAVKELQTIVYNSDGQE